jgi:hypothetical protein
MAAAAPAAAWAQNAGCAAAAAVATWRVRDMPATPTPVNALMFAMIWALLSQKEITQLCDLEAKRISPNPQLIF